MGFATEVPALRGVSTIQPNWKRKVSLPLLFAVMRFCPWPNQFQQAKGISSPRLVVIPHPLAGITADEVAKKADNAVDTVVSILTGRQKNKEEDKCLKCRLLTLINYCPVAIDMHLHPGPDAFKCRVDALEAATLAKQAGMRAHRYKKSFLPYCASCDDGQPIST